MKIVSFNVNSIRIRLHQLEAVIEKYDPDIIGLQETKVIDQDFPYEAIKMLGYESAAFGQKTHYGVALLSKQKPIEVTKGFASDTEESQKRMIEGVFALSSGEHLRVINGYFPQGESREHPVKFPGKQKFYSDLLTHISSRAKPSDNLAIIGDFNVAPVDSDLGIGEDNVKRWLRTGKASFLPEEREWLQALSDWGLYDTYREKYPDETNLFSWFDFRSRGFDRDPKRGLRIDLLMASKSLKDKMLDSGIDYDIRGMQKPSDHCPVWTEFAI